MPDVRYIIRDSAVTADDWTLIPAAADGAAAALPGGRIIVPLNVWLAQRDALLERGASNAPAQATGIWLDSHEDPAEIADAIHRFPLIAINFPKFADGRGFSLAALLRSRYAFKGELRAIGDVLRDQLFYMKRVGFNAFAVRADKDIHDAVKALKDFSVTYQGSIDEPRPAVPPPPAGGGVMTADLPLDSKVARLRELLATIEKDHSPAAFANSFGAEDMVLTHLIATEFPGIQIFTLDTLRLPKETYALADAARRKYAFRLQTYTPIYEIVEDFEARNGAFSMYDSIENRKSCCYIRKVEPLNRALALKKSWLTGLRREQAPSRKDLGESEFDGDHQLTKFNPLIDWSIDEVWAYLRANDVPYNALHDKGYPSIGCEPCTRAVKPGEDPRAGRWWWENTQAGGLQECGLHVKAIDTSALKNNTGARA